MRKRTRRKGYTLIELVLALAITSLVASCTATLIGSALETRRLADAQTAMYTASLRLHKAIDSELSAAGNVVLYSQNPATYTLLAADERVMRVAKVTSLGDKAKALKVSYNKAGSSATENLLPNSNGFDSYNGVELTEIRFSPVRILDYVTANTSTTQQLYRAVKVTTIVTYTNNTNWTYSHTSIIRFDEMMLKGTEVRICTEKSFDESKIRKATAADIGTTFPFIRYDIN